MSDLIDRQAAIDAVSKACFELRGVFGRCEDALKALPSAQSEPSTEIQEILNYLDTVLHPIVSPDNWNVYAELHDMISALPSVQLERQRGKWIEYIPEHGKCPFCGNQVDFLNGKTNSFCSECGADMRKREE